MKYRDGYIYGQHDAINWLLRGDDGDRPLAAIDKEVQPRAWGWCLANNLAVAAFGALMFRAGDNFGFHMGSDDLSQCTCQWSPGHGEPYRKSNRCEQEEIYEEPDYYCDDEIDDGEWPLSPPIEEPA